MVLLGGQCAVEGGAKGGLRLGREGRRLEGDRQSMGNPRQGSMPGLPSP